MKRLALFSCALAVALIAVACGGESATPTAAPTSPPTATTAPTATPVATATPRPGQPTATAAPPATRPAPTATAAPATPTPGKQPKSGGQLTVGAITAITTVDFLSRSGSFGVFQTMGQAFNSLVRMDYETHATVAPALAEKWSVSATGDVWTFTLRQGVKWQDGRPFTADDVAFSINRMVNPPEGFDVGFSGDVLSPLVRDAQKVDDTTVRINLKFPAAGFLESLAFPQNLIVPKHIWEPVYQAKGTLTEKHVIGTGPFRLKEHVPGISVELSKNADYWAKDPSARQLPFIDSLKFFIIGDDQAGFAAFRTKQILQTRNADRGIPAANLPIAEREQIRGYRLVRLPSYSHYSFDQVNVTKAPFSDPRFRRALHLALNRQEMGEFFDLGNKLAVLGGVMHPKAAWGIPLEELEKLPGYRADKTADREEAKRLLRAVGVPDGFEFTIVTSAGASARVAETTLNSLQAISLKPKLQVVSILELDTRQINKNFDVSFRARTEAIDDPNAFLVATIRTGGTRNLGGYSNPEMDKLLDEQMRILDPAKRKAFAKDLQLKFLEESPYIRAFFFDYVYGFWNEVQGINFGPSLWNGVGDYDRVWLDL